MQLLGFSFVILGLVGAMADNITTQVYLKAQTSSNTTSVTASSVTAASTTPNYSPSTINITGEPSDTPTSSSSSSSSSIKPSTTTTTTKREGNAKTPTPKTTVATPTTSSKDTDTNKGQTSSGGGSNVGIIIIIVIILLIAVFGIACYFAKRRSRRYSVDPTSRPDEANIPLSTIDPDMPIEASSPNGLQTFETPETAMKEPQEPGATPEVQKAEPEPAAPNPSADSSDTKPKEAATEQSLPAPVEPSAGEKTDDEDLVSNKTSVESLKETNENNSNNSDLTTRDVKLSNAFWDVPLDCPV